MICPDTDRPCRVNGCGNGQCYRRNYHEKPNEPQTPQLNIGAVSGSLLNETIFLLRKSQSENCTEWVEGIGDCGKLECDFCRIEKCIEALDSNDR